MKPEYLAEMIRNLEKEVEMMEKYCFDGFMNKINNVGTAIWILQKEIVKNKEEFNERTKEISRGIIKESYQSLKGQYQTIDFEQLPRNETFATLFLTNDYLGELGRHLEAALSGSEDDCARCQELINKIARADRPSYRQRIKEKRKKLEEFQELKRE